MPDQDCYLIITNLTTLASPQHLPSQILGCLQAGIPSETASHTSPRQANWSKQPVAVEVPFHFYHLPLLDPWLLSHVPLSRELGVTKRERTGGREAGAGVSPPGSSPPLSTQGDGTSCLQVFPSPRCVAGSFSNDQSVGRSQSSFRLGIMMTEDGFLQTSNFLLFFLFWHSA